MGLQRGGESYCSDSMISNVAELIWVNFSGIIKKNVQSFFAKEFFWKIKKFDLLESPVCLGKDCEEGGKVAHR